MFNLSNLCFTNLFLQCHRKEIQELPEVLVDKVIQLPHILKQSRAQSTSKKYENAFLRWKRWALANDLNSVDILPAKILPVALYLASVMQSSNSPGPVISAFYSIKWFHEMNGLTSPTDSKLVVNLLESSKRKLSKPVNKKEPISVNMLQDLYNRLFIEGHAKNQRIICACLLAFAGFLRSSELLKIRRSDVLFDKTHLSLFIESSKTDKYRDGAWIVISRTGTLLCPVCNLEKYFAWSNIAKDSSVFVFCTLSATKSGFKIRSDKPMSYTTLRELFIEAFTPHVDDIKKYCLHSLRSGGATAAANSGVKDRMFKRHGRWASDSAKDGYVKDNFQERIYVSQCLGL